MCPIPAPYPSNPLFSVPNPDRGEGEDTRNVLLALKLQETTGNNPSGGLGYSTHTHVCVCFCFACLCPFCYYRTEGIKCHGGSSGTYLHKTESSQNMLPHPPPQWGRDWVLYAHCCSLFLFFRLSFSTSYRTTSFAPLSNNCT